MSTHALLRAGIGQPTEDLSAGTGCSVGGRVPSIAKDAEAGFDVSGVIPVKDLKKMDRFVEFALVAAHEALESRGMPSIRSKLSVPLPRPGSVRRQRSRIQWPSAADDTPLNYLRTLRMQRAKQLLAESQQSLDVVAAAIGYRDAFGFFQGIQACHRHVASCASSTGCR